LWQDVLFPYSLQRGHAPEKIHFRLHDKAMRYLRNLHLGRSHFVFTGSPALHLSFDLSGQDAWHQIPESKESRHFSSLFYTTLSFFLSSQRDVSDLCKIRRLTCKSGTHFKSLPAIFRKNLQLPLCLFCLIKG